MSQPNASARISDLVRLSNLAVTEAQERNRRKGVPNVYCILGRIYYETPTGELSLTDPFKKDAAISETEEK